MSNHDRNEYDLALEVIHGKHGTGHRERKQSLKVSRSKYRKIQTIVNRFVERRDRKDPNLMLYGETGYQKGYRHGYIDAVQQLRIEQLGKTYE